MIARKLCTVQMNSTMQTYLTNGQKTRKKYQEIVLDLSKKERRLFFCTHVRMKARTREISRNMMRAFFHSTFDRDVGPVSRLRKASGVARDSVDHADVPSRKDLKWILSMSSRCWIHRPSHEGGSAPFEQERDASNGEAIKKNQACKKA